MPGDCQEVTSACVEALGKERVEWSSTVCSPSQDPPCSISTEAMWIRSGLHQSTRAAVTRNPSQGLTANVYFPTILGLEVQGQGSRGAGFS